MSFKQYFEERFSFTGSKSLAKGINFDWQSSPNVPGTFVGGFSYNLEDKTIENYPDLSSTPDEYFITHDLYSITLQDISKGDNPIEGFLKTHPGVLKKGVYYWISYESYEWGSRKVSSESKIPRNAKLILQTVISALDEFGLKQTDNLCFTADAEDRSRNLVYKHISNNYANSTNKKVDIYNDGDENVYLVH